MAAPPNEPAFEYRPADSETKKLKEALAGVLSSEIEIPVIINGKAVRTGRTHDVRSPHDHGKRLAVAHLAGPKEVADAIDGALKNYQDWSRTPLEKRQAVFQRAADLLSTKDRFLINAATMAGQSKTCHQAEIDSACEFIDFLRFNAFFAEELQKIQPLSPSGMKNSLQYRPLEGFVFAVTPFNFTAIGGNLPTSVALMGNVVLWKPATTALLSNYHIYRILEEAGLPPGVIQFLPSLGAEASGTVLTHPMLSGIHFTGSTSVFHSMWKTVSENMGRYKSYPRLVGETGGKDFIIAHPSSDLDVVATAITRGAFEYQGQKCSAASRAYIPKSMWPMLAERLKQDLSSIKMGDPGDFKNFMGAVIDRKAYSRIVGYLEEAKKNSKLRVISGAGWSDEVGYFIRPTVIETSDPKTKTMCEEIFGPVITIYPYEDSQFDSVLTLCDETSPYALTGSILAQDRKAIEKAMLALTNAAGNFYINNKPTGAVVGQQPFGGARASGTNDKAGSLFNLIRWVSVRTVSETLNPPKNFRYPFLES